MKTYRVGLKDKFCVGKLSISPQKREHNPLQPFKEVIRHHNLKIAVKTVEKYSESFIKSQTESVKMA